MNQKKGSGTHMYCVRNVTSDLYWVGANDRRLALFEGVYKIPKGVSYNSYVLLDDKTVVFDTVDASASRQYLENVAHVLGGRKLDYVIVQHMEMDHAATLAELVLRYPDVTIVCNEKVAEMMEQFFDFNVRSRLHLVNEGDTLCTGCHTFTFEFWGPCCPAAGLRPREGAHLPRPRRARLSRRSCRTQRGRALSRWRRTPNQRLPYQAQIFQRER